MVLKAYVWWDLWTLTFSGKSCYHLIMNRGAWIIASVLFAGAAGLPAANAQISAIDELTGISGTTTIPLPEPQVPERQATPQLQVIRQLLSEKSSEPGFDWPVNKSVEAEEYFLTGDAATFLKINDSQSEDLQDGTGKCALAPNTKYIISETPGFEGEHVKAALKEPLPGCAFTRGYIYLEHVAATSAGGACQLPPAVRAFVDTLAYAEGTTWHYNYIFTFATFTSYAAHPRRIKCIGRLCSDAAGRYQFLSDTWAPLAGDLGLKDFTPPSQDKAVMELIRRDGAYTAVAGSAEYKNFTRAVYKLNNIWASLPGSPYGQPTHSMASIWGYYKVAIAKYK